MRPDDLSGMTESIKNTETTPSLSDVANAVTDTKGTPTSDAAFDDDADDLQSSLSSWDELDGDEIYMRRAAQQDYGERTEEEVVEVGDIASLKSASSFSESSSTILSSSPAAASHHLNQIQKRHSTRNQELTTSDPASSPVATKTRSAIDLWLRQIPNISAPSHTSKFLFHPDMFTPSSSIVPTATRLQQRASEWMTYLSVGKVVLPEAALSPPLRLDGHTASNRSASTVSPPASPLLSPGYSSLDNWALNSDEDDDVRNEARDASTYSPSLDFLPPSSPSSPPTRSELDLISIDLSPTLPEIAVASSSKRVSVGETEPRHGLYFVQIAEGGQFATTVRNAADAPSSIPQLQELEVTSLADARCVNVIDYRLHC
ncbi:hypothetical protein HDU67_009333 [Dinochytrium kinnereticum]|nr:hypothetical protein HDU67_009333 [Dinochytrium kinnereticum]